ncbi:penicillin-binding protein 2 [Agromyces mediolanus]|uniref:peptidoglycan D,D-transpeptidase FtsI family protein n=1 Tax=Agromyces mediolanus TaxID=41986 RepID=UPI00203FF86B|nr:penicillin-binding protein 2 [Agromyces mediolanus]MCM3658409.1 penicillin-binding protein 2 [Agromyces mediolanus]
MKQTSRYPMRRVIVAGALLIAFVAVFVVKLVEIQVVRADEYNAEAEQVRSDSRTVYGARGDIVDRNGTVLADSVMRYDITLSPKQAKAREAEEPGQLEKNAADLGAALGIPAEQVLTVIEQSLAADADSDFAYLVKQVDVATYDRVTALKVPWVYSQEHPGRIYPNGAVAGNLLGWINDDGEAAGGLEAAQNECLAGVDGEVTSLHSLKDWVDIPGTERTVKEAQPGGTVQLTIDADLQWEVQRILAARIAEVGADWGMVTVMNAKTGELLAVADVPTVDPNDPDSTDVEDRGSRSFAAPFEPGSTFKALTAASAIDAGQADPTSEIVAPYRKLFGDANINDSEYHEDERLTLTGVLIDSSNTGMSQFGERVSDEQRYQDMVDFGLGTESEVGFPGEGAGDLNGGPDWPDDQTRYATMFGQGLTTTAIQIASVYQTLANHGVRMPVQLVQGCELADGEITGKPDQTPREVVSAKAADETTAMLERVYLEGWLAEKWNIPGYRVAAKTGTAQVADGQGGYRSEYLVSVSGYAPADDPQYVVSVSIFDAVTMNSSAASAPVFRDVMSQVLKKYRTVPSGAPAPELPASW